MEIDPEPFVRFKDIYKLIQFARYYGLSIKIEYSETEDCLEIETISPATSECFYMKRCYDVVDFIKAWNLRGDNREC